MSVFSFGLEDEGGFPRRSEPVGNAELFIGRHLGVVFSARPNVPGSIPCELDGSSGAVGVGDPDGDRGFLDHHRWGRRDDNLSNHRRMDHTHYRRVHHDRRAWVYDPVRPPWRGDDNARRRRVTTRCDDRPAITHSEFDRAASAHIGNGETRVCPRAGGERQNHADCEHRR